MAINNELKELIRRIKFKRNIKQADIARLLDITEPYLSDMINGRVPYNDGFKDKLYEVFSDCFNTTCKTQTYFGGESITEQLPLISIDAVAGFPTNDNTGVCLADCELYNVPEFIDKGAQYLIRVSGSSMYPNYANGDILACRKIDSVTFFQWGKVYVLDTCQGALVKRLFEDKEHPENVICHSDNTVNYPNFEIPKKEIRSLSIVVGVIRIE